MSSAITLHFLVGVLIVGTSAMLYRRLGGVILSPLWVMLIASFGFPIACMLFGKRSAKHKHGIVGAIR